MESTTVAFHCNPFLVAGLRSPTFPVTFVVIDLQTLNRTCVIRSKRVDNELLSIFLAHVAPLCELYNCGIEAYF